MIYHLSVYGVIFLFISFLASLGVISKAKSRYFFISLLLVVLILFIGFRGAVSVDYIPYLEIQNKVPFIYDFTLSSLEGIYGEYGFLLLVSFVKSIVNYEWFLFLVIIFFSLTLKFSFVDYFSSSQSVLIALVMYFSFYLVLFEIIQIRWGLAMGVGLFSLRFLYNKFYIRHILLCFIATSLHSYAFIFFILPYLAVYLKTSSLFFVFVFSVLFGYIVDVIGIINYILSATAGNSYIVGKLNNYIKEVSSVSYFLILKVIIVNAIFILLHSMKNRRFLMFIYDNKNLFLFKMLLVFSSYLILFNSFGVLGARVLPIVDLLLFIVILKFLFDILNFKSFITLSFIAILSAIFIFNHIVSQSYQSKQLWDYFLTEVW